ncbi:MAG: glycosyltransferase [Saprospiraceae bacterium]
MPFISYITICFNNLNDVKKTISSIDSQLIHPYEHWIIDGSKTNEIKSYLESTNHPIYRKWISEPDDGIADAFNKGINLSSGDWICLLNSGDILANQNVVQIVSNFISTHPDLDWLHGKLITKRGGLTVTIGKPFEPNKLYRGMRGVFHPTMYLKKDLYLKVGAYDTMIKIAMDYDMLCRIKPFNCGFIDQPVAIFDDNGLSSLNYIKGVKESYSIYQKYYGFHLFQFIWFLRLLLIHQLMKTRLGKWLYSIKVNAGFESW